MRYQRVLYDPPIGDDRPWTRSARRTSCGRGCCSATTTRPGARTSSSGSSGAVSSPRSTSRSCWARGGRAARGPRRRPARRHHGRAGPQARAADPARPARRGRGERRRAGAPALGAGDRAGRPAAGPAARARLRRRSRTRSRRWPSAGSSCARADRPASRRGRALLARPRAREVVPADGAVAVHDDARGLEDHALQRRRGEDLAPVGVLRRALGRVLVVDLRPHEIEQLLADDPGQDAEDQTDGLIEQPSCSDRLYPFILPRKR